MLNIIRPCTILCLWLNNLGKHFYLSIRTKFKSYCGCARSRPKNGNKNLGDSLHLHCASFLRIIFLRDKRAHLRNLTGFL